MPTIKDSELQDQTTADDTIKASATGKKRRRPGRDTTEEAGATEAEAAQFTNESDQVAADQGDSFSMDEEPRDKVHLEFYGSEIVKEKAPKLFELAETVADEWVHDGRFEGLPVGHPLAQAAASYGLRKAKKLEKTLEEKGVFMMAKVGLEYAKSKLRR